MQGKPTTGADALAAQSDADDIHGNVLRLPEEDRELYYQLTEQPLPRLRRLALALAYAMDQHRELMATDERYRAEMGESDPPRDWLAAGFYTEEELARILPTAEALAALTE